MTTAVKKESAVAELTTTEAAVLALLAIEGERSGYDLLKLVEKSIAHVWAPARSGLYAVLPRIERTGLVRSRRVSQKSRPDKQLYTITRAGLEALHLWLVRVEPGATDSVYLKLFVGGLTTPDVLRTHLEQFREDVEGRLAVYRMIEPSNENSGHDWYHRHLLRLGIARAELEVEWANSVLRALARRPR
ncbi:MAG TPA: PadR family transcriptional regulator [Gaiellaceae bacterium]|nr:PadR family transcriptional regulator [Gaiellaceae bacterium]